MLPNLSHKNVYLACFWPWSILPQQLCYLLMRLGFDSVDFWSWLLFIWIRRWFVIFNSVYVFVCEWSCAYECTCRGHRHQLPRMLHLCLAVRQLGYWDMNSRPHESSVILGSKHLYSPLHFESWLIVETRGLRGRISVKFHSWFDLWLCQSCLVSILN